MFEISGSKNTAICYASIIGDEAVNQIKRMCNYDFTENSKIRIMPDVHYGKGCTIGTTMTITNKVVPNIVGVDIGCGMYTVNLGTDSLDLEKLDKIVHIIPSDRYVWNSDKESFDLEDLKCYQQLIKVKRIKRSLGTLGGGNHFIEVNKGSDGTNYLVIHSGSRNLGKQVADYYQQMAIDIHKGIGPFFKVREDIIQNYHKQGRQKEIQSALEQLKWNRENFEADMPEDLCYLSDEYLDDYLHDIKICQQFARRNREVMAEIILDQIRIEPVESFHTIHNYIDVDEMILRKGAIAAHENEKILIPLNMRDGSILALGKGNPEWNYSAPHGAGRIMSRHEAQNKLSLKDYRETMKDIYSTSVNERTIDEAPMAYKNMNDILNDIKDTVDIIDIIKPIYNYKSST